MSKIITYSFCEPFIDNLIYYIEGEFVKKGKDLSRVAVVFGGQRPALFIKRELARRMKKSFYPPRFFAINDFMAHIVRKTEAFGGVQDMDSSYLLYQLAKAKAPHILGGRASFSQFLPWTYEILKFIDQMDLENVENDRLKNIQSAAQIGYEVPESINKLLQSIVQLRGLYHERLLKDKNYSRGLQYLRAAQLVKDTAFEEFDQVLFCNFFYFNRCEETVVKELYARDLATLIFQGDQRKWPVLERLAKKFDCAIQEGMEPQPPPFKLQLHQGFDAHSQMGLVREILKGVKNPEQAVVVLPNPDHIIPLLSEITNIVQEFNISMGYPLKRSSLYSLFEFVFKAQVSKKGGTYYTRDYLKVLRHPFVKNLSLGDTPPSPAITRTLIHKIEEVLSGKEKTDESGKLFIDLKDIESLDDLYKLTLDALRRLNIEAGRAELEEILAVIHASLFASWDGVDNFAGFAEVMEKTLDLLVHKGFLKNYPLNINIANRMYDINDEFRSAGFRKERFDAEDVFRIFDSKISREIVAFQGSPLKGLQILGSLETRSLNFETVIVADVNEGTLPTLSVYEPLIPREVMVSLGIDRLELEEEIQRYQFMRLISSAKNVHLVYQASRDKERSRFIEELIWEAEKKEGRSGVVPVRQGGFQLKVAAHVREVRKTPAMIEFLRNHCYSASSVNTYLRNPLEFYYTYVVGVKEQDDLLDEPDARHVGTFVHKLLEQSFTPFLNKKPEINAAFRKRFENLFERLFEDTIGKSLHSDAFLLKTVMMERMSRFLKNEEEDESRQVEKILYLEREFEDEVELSSGRFRFKYIVDRVDQLKDGTVMIIDYKTGSRDQMPNAVEKIAAMPLSREAVRDQVVSFQVPLYFHYLNKQFKDRPINAALYNLRTTKLRAFLGEKAPGREAINAAFLRALDFVMGEILDPDVPFVEDLTAEY
ncbi:MAG: PD-(D/E)XK nuclease family protein [Candidatus Omnitrophota bacterium]|nr:PD-(D/E)XK nuclease family protein [Candidatus Omnitrophota bacterium]MDZ4241570.1 PD-(D/E)XK nuclease family protein [Candidatus Omnitrophota bacterium]